jgi:hypothetical protein
MLLNAYAFDTMGQLALIASIVAFSGAGLMLLLSGLGFVHSRKVSPDVIVKGTDRSTVAV